MPGHNKRDDRDIEFAVDRGPERIARATIVRSICSKFAPSKYRAKDYHPVKIIIRAALRAAVRASMASSATYAIDGSQAGEPRDGVFIKGLANRALADEIPPRFPMKSIKAHWRPLGVFWDLSPVLTDVPSHNNQLTPTTQAKEPNRRIMLARI